MSELSGFLGTFVRPLIVGGELHVGEPLNANTVSRWEVELSAERTGEIDEARAAIAATLVVRPPALVFGGDELRLAVALHDALAVAHPASEGFTKKRARARLADTAARLAAVPPPTDRHEILQRHTLLHNLYALARVDTRVSWWTGRADFRGQMPPRRLLRWRTVRRVREESAEVPITEVLADPSPLERLAAASPLTDALAVDAPHRPPFDWRGKVALLRDADLARALAYAWMPRLDGDGALATAALAARAFADAWGKLPGDDTRTILAFFVHLCALVAIAETGVADLDAPSAGLARTLADADAPEALLLALPSAAARIDLDIATPPGVLEDPRLRRRFAAHRAQVEKALGGERLRELGLRLRSALRVLPLVRA